MIRVEAAYFHCARAVVRSELWNPANHADPAALPTLGQMLARLSADRVGGPAYDAALPERMRNSLW